MTIRDEVNTYCAAIGGDMDYVQGAGGNVSWKDDSTMWIKASGTWLADALEQEIFLPVNVSKLRENIADGCFDAQAETLVETALRPSIETILHAVMPHKVVVHTHLKEALFYLVQVEAEEMLNAVLDGQDTWGVVSYAKPGPELGEKVHSLLADRACDIVFLRNHGVIIGGDSVAQVKERYTRLKQVLSQRIAESQREPSLPQGADTGAPAVVGMACHKLLTQLVQSKNTAELMTTHWAMYPDHVVFLGPKAPRFNAVDNVVELAENGSPPDLALVPGVAVYISSKLNANKAQMIDFFAGFLTLFSGSENISSLSEADIAAVLNWDAEKYRQAISK